MHRLLLASSLVVISSTLVLPAQHQPLFERLSPATTGVTFQTNLDTEHPNVRLYHSGFSSGGVAVGDIDGDGRPDIYMVGGPEKNCLYRQTAPWKFEDITSAAGVDGGDAWGAGAAMADVDNDGDLDIYVCNYDAPNQLFINQGDGKFTEQARKFGVDVTAASFMPTFCDYDRDGDLDLFVLTYRAYRQGGRAANTVKFREDGTYYVLDEVKKYYRGILIGKNKDGKPIVKVKTYGHRDRLFRNNGDGTFTDVSQAAGIVEFGMGLSATWWDYNEDGWPDLYVGNDFDDPDCLYRNNKDGTFSNVLADVVPHTTWFSMGADAADLNNDGHIDFVSADMSATTHYKQKTTMGAMNAKKIAAVAGPPPQIMRNAVFLNTGTGRMKEAAYLLGIADSDWTWCVRLADFDNDGFVDVFFTNGMTRTFNDSDIPFHESMLFEREQFDVYKKAPTRREMNRAFRNTGNLGFEDVSERWGLGHVGISFGAAVSDLDGDGDLDLIVCNLDEPVSIYRNHSTGNWVTFKLRGKTSNRFGIGAVVRLRTAKGLQVRQLFPASGLLASNEPLVHFGLGSVDKIVSVTVTWPTGMVQTLLDVAVNKSHTVREEPGVAKNVEPVAPLFVPDSALTQVVHTENEFDDFRLQPLLPNKLSQLGPGMAWGDIDGDGDDDVFVGGANGSEGRILRNLGGGKFEPIECRHLRSDRNREDMGAVFFDLDSDGDLDLFVASGGVSYPNGIPLLSDRVYINDGKGGFVRADRSVLPRSTDRSSVVAACDYDRDGDVDLFVGSRMLRGRYPLAPRSRLLRNDGGKFTDVTLTAADHLQNTGLVTSAIWSDADGDGWLDLLVTHEWGPVKFFRNEKGKLVDRTAEAGLSSLTGWWNGIAARDLDGDLDIDYVVTNFGLNTKYHASEKTPALLYYGDFEKNGRMRLVEAEFENGQLFPIRGKSCSTGAMPMLGKKFPTYKSFALAELPELYTRKCLDESHRFAVTTLSSGVLRNDGKGRFTFEPLPRLAQVAPGFGVVITEVNGDGRPDIFLAQNFYGPQAETGRMDGGLGLLLTGRADGKFDTVWPDRSGFVIAGDATAATTADVNGDGWLDLVIAVNQGAVRTYLSTQQGPRGITVRLTGHKGNPTAIGARVVVHLSDKSTQTAEVHGGGGYLSQSAPTLAFGRAGAKVVAVVVHWPDGTVSRTRGLDPDSHYAIAQPVK